MRCLSRSARRAAEIFPPRASTAIATSRPRRMRRCWRASTMARRRSSSGRSDAAACCFGPRRSTCIGTIWRSNRCSCRLSTRSCGTSAPTAIGRPSSTVGQVIDLTEFVAGAAAQQPRARARPAVSSWRPPASAKTSKASKVACSSSTSRDFTKSARRVRAVRRRWRPVTSSSSNPIVTAIDPKEITAAVTGGARHGRGGARHDRLARRRAGALTTSLVVLAVRGYSAVNG